MESTIFMTLVYMAIGGSAIAIWMSINSSIIDSMNKNECNDSTGNSTGDSTGNSSVVDDIQSLYTWLTIIIIISFIGIVIGVKGITEFRDFYNVKEIFPLIFIASTILTIFIATGNVSSNKLIQAMTKLYSPKNEVPIKANHTITTFLTIMMIVAGISGIGILVKGREVVTDLHFENEGRQQQQQREQDQLL